LTALIPTAIPILRAPAVATVRANRAKINAPVLQIAARLRNSRRIAAMDWTKIAMAGRTAATRQANAIPTLLACAATAHVIQAKTAAFVQSTASAEAKSECAATVSVNRSVAKIASPALLIARVC